MRSDGPDITLSGTRDSKYKIAKYHAIIPHYVEEIHCWKSWKWHNQCIEFAGQAFGRKYHCAIPTIPIVFVGPGRVHTNDISDKAICLYVSAFMCPLLLRLTVAADERYASEGDPDL